jgi:sugar phosphate permease
VLLIISNIFKEFHDLTLQEMISQDNAKDSGEDIGKIAIGGYIFSIGAIIAIILSGIISDRVLSGRCFILIVIMNIFTIIYDFMMVFIDEDSMSSAGRKTDAFFVGFLSDGTRFMF